MSPPTIWTWRVARRSSRRCRSFPARCFWSPMIGRCWTRWARGRWPSRRAACAATSAAGPSTCACARSARPPAQPVDRRARRAPGGARTGGRRRAQRTRRAAAARSQERLEREIAAAEAALRKVEDELADPAAWASPEATARSTARHREAKRAVEELYDELERIAG